MLCPKCQVELQIERDNMEVTGDNSSQETTRVYDVQELICKNTKCENFGQIVKVVKHLVYES